MTEGLGAPGLILCVGLLAVMSMILQAVLKRWGVSPLIGFFLLGFGLRLTGESWSALPSEIGPVLEFMGQIGIITLLFRIGLESRPAELLRQLPQASLVAVVGIILSGGIGFMTVFWVLDEGLIPSLVLATAMTATSVGISVGAWQDAGALQSPQGELLLDVAEIDDLAAILLMALLFSVLPILENGAGNSILPALGQSLGTSLIQLAFFAALCLAFALYLEEPLSDFIRKVASPPGYMLVIAGIGIILAAVAGLLGFSLAIGAFFAGLAYSRDPEAVKHEASFLPLYDFFSPFFFINVGFRIEPESLFAAGESGLVLLAAAVVGKLLAGLPVWFLRGFPSAVLIGISLVPRAEIFLVIITQALQSAGVISRQMFSAMVLVSAVTCLLSPLGLRFLFRRWPPMTNPSA